jgi:LSD1 subclass zinc finger protein
MKETRCGQCRKLLFKAAPEAVRGPLDIKCPRCGTINSLRPVEPISERPGKPVNERETHGEISCGCISRNKPSAA